MYSVNFGQRKVTKIWNYWHVRDVGPVTNIFSLIIEIKTIAGDRSRFQEMQIISHASVHLKYDELNLSGTLFGIKYLCIV